MPSENGHDEGSSPLHEILKKLVVCDELRLATNDQVFEHRTQSLSLKLNELTD